MRDYLCRELQFIPQAILHSSCCDGRQARSELGAQGWGGIPQARQNYMYLENFSIFSVFCPLARGFSQLAEATKISIWNLTPIDPPADLASGLEAAIKLQIALKEAASFCCTLLL